MSGQRNTAPVRWQPSTLSDAVDGTNTGQGAMSILQNLIPAPATMGMHVPRPAATQMSVLADEGVTGAGALSSLLVVGDKAYSLVPSNLNAGKDEPVLFDLSTVPPTRIAVAGITNVNTPTSPVAAGDWTPPIMAQIGSRIVVTHPGFAGGTSTKPWISYVLGNLTSGSNLITGNPLTVTATPPFFIQNGIEVGQRLYHTNLPFGSTITELTETTVPDVCTGTSGSADIVVNSATGIEIGMAVSILGNYLPGPGAATVVAIAGTTITMDQLLSSNVPVSTPVFFFGSTITMSEDATGSADGVLVLTLGGGTGVMFGWYDISGFESKIRTSMTLGVPMLTGSFSTIGVQPGMTLVGDGVPANTSVVATQDIVILASAVSAAGDVNLTGVAAIQYSGGLIIRGGMSVSGAGIPAGAFVIGADQLGSVALSAPAALTGNITITIVGSLIVMSDVATASADYIDVDVAGGTADAPLWGAGDMDRYPFPSQPVGVAQFSGRGYYACGTDGVAFSDSGFPCRRSNAIFVQQLATNDGLAVTAVAPLLLSAPLTGGIVKALLAFEGTSKIQQITGDLTTNNLKMDALPVATGTDAPLSIVPCEKGTAFISPLGLRFVMPDGTVSGVIGEGGGGVTQPFQYAAAPSQICGAATVGLLRYSVQNNLLSGAPYQEYWYHLVRGVWSGPHTFSARVIQPWRSTFVMGPRHVPGELWRSDAYGSNESSYVENGAQLSWIWQTILLPDSGAVKMNALIESNIAIAADPTNRIAVAAIDEELINLDSIRIETGLQLRERLLEWTTPLVFKQMFVRANGPSDYTVTIGNLYMLYEILGYNLGPGGEGNYLGTDEGIILQEDDPGEQLLAPG